MAIDMYFIGKCKEIMTLSKAREVSYGWGVTQNGKLRRPEQWLKNAPIVIDDSITARISESFLQTLLPYCDNGCILDFERKAEIFHLSMIRFLCLKQVRPLWVPANYSKLAQSALIITLCDLPHNSWRNFCAAQQNIYGNQWVMEYHPLNNRHTVNNQNIVPKPVYLDNAICMAQRNKDNLYYFDTIKTISEKIRIAEEYGCRGILSIAAEWNDLK